MGNSKVYVDEYGFDCLEINTSEGGRIILTDFKSELDKDIHLYSSWMSPHGLGYSKNIYTNEDIDKAIKDTHETIWLEEDEKENCVNFLETRKVK